MSAVDFITLLFCRVDEEIGHLTKHPQGRLHPSEIVTLAMLYALKGVGQRAFYRWPLTNHLALFAKAPERTRLFHSFHVHTVAFTG